MRRSRKRIALLVESSREYGRGLLLGIAQFAQINDSWVTTHHPERSLSEELPSWFRASEFDGIIFRSESESALREVMQTGLPVIDLYVRQNSPAVVVDTDDEQVVRLAANHLMDRGHRVIGFCGYEGLVYSEKRRDFLVKYLEKKGCRLFVYETPSRYESRQSIHMVESAATIVEEPLLNWLREIPKPAGVICCNDIRGNQVLNACRDIGLDVPEEVSLIGVDNDPVICNLAIPSLSSVANNTELIGYRAAEYLNELMEGRAVAQRSTFIAPAGIVARQSTDAAMIDDEMVARALVYIRENACSGIEVSDVVDQLPMSRATIERRFRKAMDRSLNDEIKRIRIARIKQLLSDTDMKLPSIAKLAGFNHPEYMSSLFKKEVGQTPGQYRREHQWKQS